jgi:class 3 adenylate cyclase
MILKRLHFKTLQNRLIVLLLLPVFLIIFSGGVLSFFYTRNAILEQWNDSAVLKLQRAAHYIEMRLLKPVELMEMLFQLSNKKHTPISPDSIAEHIKTLEGVIQVEFKETSMMDHSVSRSKNSMRTQNGMAHFRHSRISNISNPEYDTDVGHETVTLVLTLIDGQGHENGHIEIKMSFNYLLKDIIKLGWWQSDMACIVDQKGKYMAHTNMQMKGRHYLGGENDPLELMILKKMDTTAFGTIQSQGHPPDMVAGFYKLEQIPWTIILFAKGKNILKPIIHYRNAFALGSAFLIMVVLMLIRHHVGKIVRQIQTLSENARKVAGGEYGPPVEVNSRDEIGQLVENHNDMVKGLVERDFIRDSFGRYVDPKFAKYLLEHPGAGDLGGKRREVVMMMSDIRGFTALSETLSPELIIRILNQYFSHMIKIIQDHNGIIVDFFGDAILVFFEPLSGAAADTALCCVQCAARMQSEMKTFNDEMQKQKLPGLAMGIGINAGQVIVGNIGSDTRAKYGVVGSAVNITSRIQAKAEKQEIVISESVYQYTKDQLHIKKTFSAELKGVDEPVTLRIIENLIS